MAVVRSLVAAVTLVTIMVVALLSPPVSATGWPPCPTEDSVGCFWDAQHRGNGLGRSFVTYPDGRTRYL